MIENHSSSKALLKYGLTADNPLALSLLTSKPTRFFRNRVLWQEGERLTGFYIVHQGWAANYIKGSSGTQEIVRLLLPGDVVGLHDIVSGAAQEAFFAITDVDLIYVSFGQFSSCIAKFPASANLFLMSLFHDAATALPQMVRQSRSSARARLAQFLLGLAKRLGSLGLVERDGFDLPLTQEVIATVIGMTPIHANRTIRAFEAEGLIIRDGRRIVINQRDELLKLAPDFPTDKGNFSSLATTTAM